MNEEFLQRVLGTKVQFCVISKLRNVFIHVLRIMGFSALFAEEFTALYVWNLAVMRLVTLERTRFVA